MFLLIMDWFIMNKKINSMSTDEDMLCSIKTISTEQDM